MIRYIIKQDCFIKRIILHTMLFFAPLYSMDEVAQELPVVSYSFLLLTIPIDVIHAHLKQKVGYQGIGRVKHVSKACNICWNVDKICPNPSGCASICCVPACRQLVKNFDACTKALGYYARQDNKKMFRHLWSFSHKKRRKKVSTMLSIKNPTLKNCMDVYRGNFFSETEKIILRSESLARALFKKDNEAINIILLNKDFDICRGVNYYTSLLKCACQYGDIAILLQALGGVDHINDADYSGKSAIHYTWKNFLLFSQLMAYGANIDKIDGNCRTVLFHAVQWGNVDYLRYVLTRKPNLCIVDNIGCTVAHHAIIQFKDHPEYTIGIIDLLLDAGIDVYRVNGAGDSFLSYIPFITPHFRRKAVKDLLKKHGIKKEKTWRMFF